MKRGIDMTKEEMNINNWVSKKEIEAYQNYIRLTSYENIVFQNYDKSVFCDDYTVRDFTFPMDIYVK
jgi:hypothetical protein